MRVTKCDFGGWATRNDIKCSDGRTIRKNAFAHNDGTTVPLVWNHQHDDPSNVLGHALLENRDQGVYAYCTFNDTPNGETAKHLVKHGDVKSLSIYANQLQQKGGDVLHGEIREVSVVLAGANPGARIEEISHSAEEGEIIGVINDITFAHGDMLENSAVIRLTKVHDNAINYVDIDLEDEEIKHADAESEAKAPEEKNGKEPEKENKEMADNKEKTVADVIDSMSEEQKTVMYALIGQALEDAKGGKNESEGDNKEMKQNVFDYDEENSQAVLSHSDVEAIFGDMKRYGSLKESFLAHTAEYGIEDIDWLYPEDHKLSNVPGWYKEPDGWVSKVMNGVHHVPFSRIKSMYGDITGEEARARGYVKGNQKAEEVIALLKRSTTPTTIYKKQKLDRDDVIDITDFDVVAWLKQEMRWKLDEEIARAILISDGRVAGTDDKISEDCIRPIWKDNSTYVINKVIEVTGEETEDEMAKAFIRTAVKSRKGYKGSGNPTLFTTEDMLTDMLLMEDLNGRVIYETVDKLATALRVKEIVTVPVMENKTRSVEGVTRNLMGIIVNLSDYTVGADKGGAVSMFDDFDIDVNQMKYLIETRCSGSLMAPDSAIVIESAVAED